MNVNLEKIKQLKILVAEDDTQLQTLMHDFFSKFHTSFTIASNGNEALAILQNNQFDILLTDIVMPDMDGIELIKNVNKKYPQLKIIVISANAKMKYLDELQELHYHEFMTKPFDIMKLLDMINKLFE